MQYDVVNSKEMLGAVSRQDAAAMRALLESGYSVDQSVWSDYVFTALHQVAAQGFVDGCRVLIEYGATVNLAGVVGVTALHKAASFGHADICLLLMEAGANVHAVDNVGSTVLMHAAGAGGENPARVLRALIAAGADPNVENRYGATALRATINGEVAQILLAAGADSSHMPKGGSGDTMTPFQWAVKRGCVDVVRACLEHGDIDLAQRSSSGRTLAQLAGRNKEVRQLLLAAKTALVVNGAVADEDSKTGSLNGSHRPAIAPL